MPVSEALKAPTGPGVGWCLPCPAPGRVTVRRPRASALRQSLPTWATSSQAGGRHFFLQKAPAALAPSEQTGLRPSPLLWAQPLNARCSGQPPEEQPPPQLTRSLGPCAKEGEAKSEPQGNII